MKKLLKIYYPAIALLMLIILYKSIDNPEDATVEIDSVIVNYNKFNLVVDSLVEYQDVVKRNQTLADLLLPHNLNYQEIINIASELKNVFDVRKIAAGDSFAIYSSFDSLENVNYFVYQEDKVNYFVVNLTDSIEVYRGKIEVTLRTREVSGEIDNSLWETFLAQKIDPMLAIRLSEIYAWQIDFYTVQKGDKFRAIYEEQFIDDEYIGIAAVHAASFNHFGKNYFAFEYVNEEKSEYFDEEGKSLSKAFLKAPVRFSRISSGFTGRRFHPILKRYRSHYGIDYAAPLGTPVQSVGDGLVVEARYRGQEGKFVKIKHNGTYSSGYLHLSRYGPGIKKGARIKQGDIVGYVGSTGLSTGPHLDFRFWINGTPVNYLVQEFPSSRSVSKEKLPEYINFITPLYTRLDSLDILEKKNQIALTARDSISENKKSNY